MKILFDFYCENSVESSRCTADEAHNRYVLLLFIISYLLSNAMHMIPQAQSKGLVKKDERKRFHWIFLYIVIIQLIVYWLIVMCLSFNYHHRLKTPSAPFQFLLIFESSDTLVMLVVFEIVY